MTRFDLYTHVHKAVRVLLFDALTTVGRTDFSNESEIPALAATVRRTLRLTRSHAEHEDREIHPLLHRLAPELAAELEAGHNRFDGIDQELESCLERIANSPAAVRVSLGRRMHEMLGALVADHLHHMVLEESRASRVLWAHFTDEELMAVQGRVVGSMPAAELNEWVERMLPAGNATERAQLSAALEGAAP